MQAHAHAIKTEMDCECCDAKSVTVHHLNNMWMCDACYASDIEVMSQKAQQTLAEARTKDSEIKSPKQLFTADTVPAIELRAAIENDTNISDAEKDYAYTKECAARMQKMQRVIFEERQSLRLHEEESKMWHRELQMTVPKLRQEWREQFKSVDILYPIAPITKKEKSTKTPSAHKPSKRFGLASLKELREAADKYGVPYLAVQSNAAANNMTAEDAARDLAKKMNLLKK